MTKNTYNLLTIVVLIMAIIQAPFIYYYTFGLFALFIISPYLLIGSSLTIWLSIVTLRNKKTYITLPYKIIVFITILIGSSSFFWGEEIIEKLDWKFRKSTREEIIELVKINKLKPNATHNNIICTLKKWNFPPISNGGNEIAIHKTNHNKLTVEFYINRGFLDHYSAFVYTNNTEKIKELEESLSYKKESHQNKKLDENWYRVSY